MVNDNNNENNNENNNGIVNANTNSRFAAIKAAAKSFANKTSDVAVNVKNGIVNKKNEIITQNNERKLVAAEKEKRKELDKLLPMFEGDLAADNFRHERVIRIVNYDKRLDNELCKGSVGFYERTPNRLIPTIYTKYVEKMGFSFYPHLSESVYIADPCIFGNYIEIDEYFNHMKQVRVNELTLIAQSLGAKHVEIRLQSANKNMAFENRDGGLNVPNVNVKANMTRQRESKKAVEIWACTDFEPGFWLGGPTMPNVLYFRNESDIQTLIQMALANKSKITKRTYSMRASSSSGMSLSEAANINASLKSIKANAGLTFEKRANDESEAVLEYTIEF